MQLQNNNLPNGVEKYLKWILLAGAGIAGFWFWGSISGFVVKTLANTLKTIVYGGILAAILLFVWSYPDFIAMSYRTICRKIQSIFIKMDPLSFMDRYADILSGKLTNVNKTIVKLNGEEVNLERRIEKEKSDMDHALKMGAAAVKTGNASQASLWGTRAKGAENSIKLYTPNLMRMRASLSFLSTLSENWDVSITTMREEIERKRTEWRILKQNAAALNQAQEFLRGDTEEGRIYQESIKALEMAVSQKIAYIEDFEKKAKPIMEGAIIEKTMKQDEGMQMLQDYMNDKKLLMPDFSKLQAVDIDSEPVVETKFNLLKN